MRCCRAVAVRHKCVEGVSLEGTEIKNTIVITFAFQVVFTSFNALQNLHSSLHDEESLGNICLAILYFTAILSSILSPTIIGLIGAKTVIVAAFAAHCIYVLANFYPSLYTMGPAAVALGAFHGPAWTSQALYISASAYSFSKSSSSSPYTVLSRFNGFFFAVFATAQIVGNLVTSTIIKDGLGNVSEEAIWKFCGPQDCPHHENATMIEDPEEWVLDITLGFLMACTLLGLLLVICLLNPLPRSEWIQRVSVRETATSCFQVLMSLKMILLVPLIFFTAAEHAFLMSAYTKSYVACPVGIHLVGYVMAVYGVTTPVFVYIFSHLARIAGRFILLMLSLSTHILLFIVLFRWVPTPDDLAIIFIIPIVWGVSESVLQAQANALIAMLFPTQKEPAFANFHAWRSLGYAITFLNASYMCVSTKLILCMTFASVGTVLYFVLEFKSKIKQKMAFKRPRSSIVSISGNIDSKRDSITENAYVRKDTILSLQSVHEHMSFNRVELADIIMEAQQSWTRDEKGLNLDIGKVMSQEHLAGSKATSWYHTGPLLYDYLSQPRQLPAVQPRLPRALSDGQLLYAAEQVNTGVDNIRRGRIHSCPSSKDGQDSPDVSGRRHTGHAHVTFDVIQEAASEEEMPLEKEAAANEEMAQKEFETIAEPGDVIKEDESREIRAYRKYIRRLSETLPKDTQRHIERGNMSDSSGVYSGRGHDNPSYLSDEEDTGYENDFVFTEGSSWIIPDVFGNTVIDSATGIMDNTVYSSVTSGDFLRSCDERTVQLNDIDQRLCHEHDNVTSSVNLNDSGKYKTHPEKLSGKDLKVNQKKQKKRKRLFSLKGLQKAKKGNSDSTKTLDVKIQCENPDQEGQEVAIDEVSSEADSDGFVDNEVDDNKSYIITDFAEVDKSKRKKRIPVSEMEDVSCIY